MTTATTSGATSVPTRRSGLTPTGASAHDALQRSADGTPLAFATGSQVFMGVELLVEVGALIPRSETELLGHTALELLRAGSDGADRADGAGLTIVDMCCGAGNLACGIAAALEGLRVHAADLTDGCVSLARRNVARLGLQERVTVHQGDLFGALEGCGVGPVDLVVANPPYISTSRLERDRAELLRHEPREAFDGGPYGLTIHQRLIKEAVDVLRPGGWLLCEIGLGQARQVERLFARAGSYEAVRFVTDAAGDVRVAVARRLRVG